MFSTSSSGSRTRRHSNHGPDALQSPPKLSFANNTSHSGNNTGPNHLLKPPNHSPVLTNDTTIFPGFNDSLRGEQILQQTWDKSRGNLDEVISVSVGNTPGSLPRMFRQYKATPLRNTRFQSVDPDPQEDIMTPTRNDSRKSYSGLQSDTSYMTQNVPLKPAHSFEELSGSEDFDTENHIDELEEEYQRIRDASNLNTSPTPNSSYLKSNTPPYPSLHSPKVLSLPPTLAPVTNVYSALASPFKSPTISPPYSLAAAEEPHKLSPPRPTVQNDESRNNSSFHSQGSPITLNSGDSKNTSSHYHDEYRDYSIHGNSMNEISEENVKNQNEQAERSEDEHHNLHQNYYEDQVRDVNIEADSKEQYQEEEENQMYANNQAYDHYGNNDESDYIYDNDNGSDDASDEEFDDNNYYNSNYDNNNYNQNDKSDNYENHQHHTNGIETKRQLHQYEQGISFAGRFSTLKRLCLRILGFPSYIIQLLYSGFLRVGRFWFLILLLSAIFYIFRRPHNVFGSPGFLSSKPRNASTFLSDFDTINTRLVIVESQIGKLDSMISSWDARKTDGNGSYYSVLDDLVTGIACQINNLSAQTTKFQNEYERRLGEVKDEIGFNISATNNVLQSIINNTHELQSQISQIHGKDKAVALNSDLESPTSSAYFSWSKFWDDNQKAIEQSLLTQVSNILDVRGYHDPGSVNNSWFKSALEEEMDRLKLEITRSHVDFEKAIDIKIDKATQIKKFLENLPKLLDSENLENTTTASVLDRFILAFEDAYRASVVSKPNFASLRTGTVINHKLTSKFDPWPTRSIFYRGYRSLAGLAGFGRIYIPPPEIALINNLELGECWPFNGKQGVLVLKLANNIHPTDIIVGNVRKQETYIPTSAPRQISLWVQVKDKIISDQIRATIFQTGPESKQLPEDFVMVGTFEYDIHSPEPRQLFSLDARIRDIRPLTDQVAFVFDNNWGNNFYTCIYQLQLFGERVELGKSDLEEAIDVQGVDFSIQPHVTKNTRIKIAMNVLPDEGNSVNEDHNVCSGNAIN
ncbi:hypothetical protein NADFUDRAFT_42924 [Nadsonia fulvescens var. elongata DSM 6958]|uniref:SUN domain-containing protein n=1 Tax=Nadsonia fulvescens var. elongata DSM 6958 TaxID=857566 RepID=A0A1E3PGX2_9ASCO|nr:hypothetical protein NADFUDRAFT_42924 [Nadsonia fulvescens var. elongata DSM 6958]